MSRGSIFDSPYPLVGDVRSYGAPDTKDNYLGMYNPNGPTETRQLIGDEARALADETEKLRLNRGTSFYGVCRLTTIRRHPVVLARHEKLGVCVVSDTGSSLPDVLDVLCVRSERDVKVPRDEFFAGLSETPPTWAEATAANKMFIERRIQLIRNAPPK